MNHPPHPYPTPLVLWLIGFAVITVLTSCNMAECNSINQTKTGYYFTVKGNNIVKGGEK